MVFAGVYPVDSKDYEELRTSIEKLRCFSHFYSRIFHSSWFSMRIFRYMEIKQDRLHRETIKAFRKYS